ncbi:MAG: epoxyqueuosine reductase [Spirochaetaceae bacterium]|jgi:epoxyqueuosine reductase|nr:epoxyqueuosine reductase [Spirochaetaceae bacterium]
MRIEEKIQQKAYELGVHKCGIIKPEAMADYADRLRERMARIPNGEKMYGNFLGFANITERVPWAKSIIVLVFHYGHYVLPDESVVKSFAKYYLVDARFNAAAAERKMLMAFDDYLHEAGLKTVWNEHPGITAMRWAAHKAGLGIIRKNNFFYTEKGSWVNIVAIATDREMELVERHSLPECPDGCGKCSKACPTKSLSAPYTMNMATCISRLTASNDADSYDDTTNRQIGRRLYGCDACQDVCPMNKDKWESRDVFPELSSLNAFLSPEAVLASSYADLERQIMPKFFYIKKEGIWRWKLNAINALVNRYSAEYDTLFRQSLQDEYEIVRKKARWALDKTAEHVSDNR